MHVHLTELCRGITGRWAGATTLGIAIISAMAGLPGCSDSSAVHVADPAAAAKTLPDPKASPELKKTSNKKLQKYAEQEQAEIAKHPKIR